MHTIQVMDIAFLPKCGEIGGNYVYYRNVKWAMPKIYSDITWSIKRTAGKGPLGRPRRRWEDYLRMDLEEIGISAGNSIDSAQDRDLLEGLCECGIEPPGSIRHGVS